MTQYLVTFAASAKKELTALPTDMVARLLPGIRELTIRALPGVGSCTEYRNRWRIRVGNYRVVYAIDDAGRSVDITRIAHRKEVYE